MKQEHIQAFIVWDLHVSNEFWLTGDPNSRSHVKCLTRSWTGPEKKCSLSLHKLRKTSILWLCSWENCSGAQQGKSLPFSSVFSCTAGLIVWFDHRNSSFGMILLWDCVVIFTCSASASWPLCTQDSLLHSTLNTPVSSGKSHCSLTQSFLKKGRCT